MQRRREENSSVKFFNKFARGFALLMTLLYVALGLFILLADEQRLNLTIPETVKTILGGILILYGVLRFVRVYQGSKQKKRYED
ncbi:hypothetical protein [Pontibacter liquoris]|uniref:hypothetical protein n=1 Tax=Pontibacter liquoris TaxID=2905677 RepID=UPI001FA78C52|nr:hypothetical protein [Pontibacter liquoris]